jgi:hypothetical protein
MSGDHMPGFGVEAAEMRDRAMRSTDAAIACARLTAMRKPFRRADDFRLIMQ